MNLGSGMDQVKIVDWHRHVMHPSKLVSISLVMSLYPPLAYLQDICFMPFPPRSCNEDPTQLVTNLGNNDAMNATDATAQFVFNQGGSFKVCYKLKVLPHIWSAFYSVTSITHS